MPSGLKRGHRQGRDVEDAAEDTYRQRRVAGYPSMERNPVPYE